MTGEEALKSLEKQVREVRTGIRRDVIRCPYCGSENNENVPVCCNLFSLAVRAILDRLEVDEQKEQWERIGEALTAGKRKN